MVYIIRVKTLSGWRDLEPVEAEDGQQAIQSAIEQHRELDTEGARWWAQPAREREG
jgi:hypothetical protein